MLARNIVAAASAGANDCSTNIPLTVAALRWRDRGFGLLQSLSLYSRGGRHEVSLSVAKWNPNDTDIRIRAPHTRAARLARRSTPVEFRLHSRTPRRNFYS